MASGENFTMNIIEATLLTYTAVNEIMFIPRILIIASDNFLNLNVY